VEWSGAQLAGFNTPSQAPGSGPEQAGACGQAVVAGQALAASGAPGGLPERESVQVALLLLIAAKGGAEGTSTSWRAQVRGDDDHNASTSHLKKAGELAARPNPAEGAGGGSGTGGILGGPLGLLAK
jgi:hypothetical protein